MQWVNGWLGDSDSVGSSSCELPFWYISSKVWDEIIYPFLNFNGATVEA